jgi:transitional endoplasmic reticulum ATPase
MTTAAKRTGTAIRAVTSEKPLSPAQEVAYARLLQAVEMGALITFEGAAGAGKTLLTDRLIAAKGGVRVDCRDVITATPNTPHPGIDEIIHRLIEEKLRQHDLVVWDDFDLSFLTLYSEASPRRHYYQVMLQALAESASAAGKKLVLCGASFYVAPEYHYLPRVQARAHAVEIPALTSADYAFFLELELGEKAKSVSPGRLYEYAPNLTVHQIQRLCAHLRLTKEFDEADLRSILDTSILVSNANLGEVADIKFSDLKGFEHILEQLTTYVLNPLMFDARFEGLKLTPKRGVLLYGPPGTGKTSIGRALAHQMKGKFFMIDGTFTTEPPAAFYHRVKQLFDAAKLATPSVVFIDDADVLFQSDRSTGLNRFLLTMLDGLESATAGKVAVIMTAMDPNHLPAALLRSGRVELWLETKPPASVARGEMVAALVADLPDFFRSYDLERMLEVTEGFNAADMKRVVADVKALYARDVLGGREPRAVDEYFNESGECVKRNKELLYLAETGRLMAEAERNNDEKANRRRRDADDDKCS